MRKLDDILKEINCTSLDDQYLEKLHREKSTILESMKPSTMEDILYFLEKDIENIPFGFNKVSEEIHAPLHIEKRSYLEYNKIQRHPIPYCVIKCSRENKYFLSLREGNSSEMRLIGKKGLLGGHVAKEDLCYKNVYIDNIKSIRNGMYRELEEEAGITKNTINSVKFLGLLKLEGDVESDHIGFIYEIDINTTKIDALEKGVLSGIWCTKEEIKSFEDTLETWAYVIYKDLLKF